MSRHSPSLNSVSVRRSPIKSTASQAQHGWGREDSKKVILHVLLLRHKKNPTCLGGSSFGVSFWNSCCRHRIKHTPLLPSHCAEHFSRRGAGLGDRHHHASWKGQQGGIRWYKKSLSGQQCRRQGHIAWNNTHLTQFLYDTREDRWRHTTWKNRYSSAVFETCMQWMIVTTHRAICFSPVLRDSVLVYTMRRQTPWQGSSPP